MPKAPPESDDSDAPLIAKIAELLDGYSMTVLYGEGDSVYLRERVARKVIEVVRAGRPANPNTAVSSVLASLERIQRMARPPRLPGAGTAGPASQGG